MAGMVPGVECARRRRFHQSGAADLSVGSSRRPSFSLYATGHDLRQRTTNIYKGSHASQSGDLGDMAREAKQRLDLRLGNLNRRNKNMGSMLARPWREAVALWLRKKKVSGDGVECVVCLEEMVGEGVEELRCGHRFHGRCVKEWLQRSSRCPCCRAQVPLPE